MSADSPETDWAWAAGFFDGEGCISVSKPRKLAPRSRQIQLNAAQICREPLDKLESICGGVVREQGRKTDFGSTVFRWTCGPLVAKTVLKRFLPYLTVKKEKAERVLAYQSFVSTRGIRPTRQDFEKREKILAGVFY